MSFQFIEKRGAFSKAFESEISFHPEIKSIPSEAKSLRKSDQPVADSCDEICLAVASTEKIGRRKEVGDRFQQADGTQDKGAVVCEQEIPEATSSAFLICSEFLLNSLRHQVPCYRPIV